MRDLLHRQILATHLSFSAEIHGDGVTSIFYPFDYKIRIYYPQARHTLERNCENEQAWVRRLKRSRGQTRDIDIAQLREQIKDFLANEKISRDLTLSERSLVQNALAILKDLSERYNPSDLHEFLLTARQITSGNDLFRSSATRQAMEALAANVRDRFRSQTRFQDLKRDLVSSVCRGVVSSPSDAFNDAIERIVFEDGIIIRTSPPEATGLAELISKYGAVIGGGTVFGLEISNYLEKPELFFVFLPVGMIVIGASAGVAFGLRHGLEDYIKEIFRDIQRRSYPADEDDKGAE
jgi:hypothetical protein